MHLPRLDKRHHRFRQFPGLVLQDGLFNSHLHQIKSQSYCIANCAFVSTSAVLRGKSSWQQRQANDPYCRTKDRLGYRSRAAFKLIDLHKKYDIFRPGQTVIDLGYAPGSWSQVAREHVGSSGRVLGIDILEARPPPGVTTITGNFLDKSIQRQIKAFLMDRQRGRVENTQVRAKIPLDMEDEDTNCAKDDSRSKGTDSAEDTVHAKGTNNAKSTGHTETIQLSQETVPVRNDKPANQKKRFRSLPLHELNLRNDLTKQLPGNLIKQEQASDVPWNFESCPAHVLLSDMCGPSPEFKPTFRDIINNSLQRMSNFSGIPVRDHSNSIVTLPSPFCLFFRLENSTCQNGELSKNSTDWIEHLDVAITSL